MENKLRVDASNGKFIGVERNGVISYKGIPYAKPPVGRLRWKPTEELEKSSQTIMCHDFGNSSIQSYDPIEKACLHKQSEDCLTLNIWMADDDAKTKKPVMVWFHGGVYGWGGTADPICDGHNFVKAHNDIIYVSINSRLGVLGYIDLSDVPGGEAYTEPNLGLCDQITALKWIHENIEAFGGDADNVTLFGHSSGAVNIGILMTMDRANKYFKRAIVQDGPYLRGIEGKRIEGKNVAQLLMEATGSKNMDELLALTEGEIKKANDENEFSVFCPGPMSDGGTYENIIESMTAGKSRHIDLLIGSNEDEFYYTAFIEGSIEAAGKFYERKLRREKESMNEEQLKLIEEFEDLYKGVISKEELPIKYWCESKMRIPTLKQALAHKKERGNAYVYLWRYPSSLEGVGACMAVDVSYVLNNLHETTYSGENPNIKLAEDIQKSWVNFAKTGNPSFDNVKWPQYDEKTRVTMIIDKNADWHTENDPLSRSRMIIEEISD